MNTNTQLYPLKFSPIFKTKIWGGNKMATILGKATQGVSNIGESWEISGVPGDISIVANGPLQGTNLLDCLEQYKDKLVGSKVYSKFGPHFPILIKFIDANDYLSIQVHPDDAMAMEKHNSFGKTEMWYIVDAEKDAKLIVGFNQELDRQKYEAYFKQGKLREVLNFEKVEAGDVFHLPAGRIHATGPGILFAEIQQTSDLTYRIYDWDRVDDNGNERELHTEQALETIDFCKVDQFKTVYNDECNTTMPIVSCAYYTTNIIKFNKTVIKDYSALDSFVIYMAIEGETNIKTKGFDGVIELKKGESILIPAFINHIECQPIGSNSRILEVYL